MGPSAAAALARSGHRVTLYEAGTIPNPRGASCDEHRAIRTAYRPSRGYMRMARLAYAAWDRLWAELGMSHYQETGLLMVRSPGSPPRGPMLIDVQGESGFHLPPPVAGTGLKAGDHRFTLQGDPEGDPRRPAPADWVAIEAACARRLARFDAFRRGTARICFCACTPDEGFVLRPLSEPAILLSACSGHGFKFGALMGEAAALALDDPDWGWDHAPAWAAGAEDAPAPPRALRLRASARRRAAGRRPCRLGPASACAAG
jgi:glycine/D-amino acid oxidase-like deaminating enzyme